MSKCFSLLLFLALAFQTQMHAALLFDRGTNWRWRPGTNEASTPLSAWRSNEFNEVEFTTAPSPFWYDATGDSSTLTGGTVITGMQNNYLCLFLRKTFTITNLSEIGGLRLGALVDDGFVAWINGTEVYRVNMPDPAGSPVTTNTLASNAAEPVPFLVYNLPTPPSYLRAGSNTIAVQIFQSSLASSDIGFDASLETILTETIPPTVLSAAPAAGGTVNNLTQITVTFSEPVSGVSAADLLVNGIGTTAVLPLDSSTYTFSFAQPAYGTVQITWASGHGITDQALPPNPFNGTGPGATWQYNLVDNTAPVVASLTPPAGSTVRSLTAITVLFSEPVSGVNAADLLVNNNPASSVATLSSSQYTFTFTQPPTGTVQVAWAAGHGITDQAASPNAFAGGNWTYRLDPNASDLPPYISEFMASNTRTLADENGSFEDWIEIYNPSSLTLNLEDWALTDSLGDLGKWRFPATNLAGGAFLVVFASEKDRRIPGGRLHTNFRLSAGGEYLALVQPDGRIVSEFRPGYTNQVPDVSYGFPQFGDPPLFTAGSNAVYFTVPTPGTANLGGTNAPGPSIVNVRHTPNTPLENDDLIVTARVAPSFFTVAGVTMSYRIMFGNEVTLPMFDDGAHGDGLPGDGTFGATIPASASTNGQMIRYYISATDVNGRVSRWPLFPTPTNSAQYLGTVVNPNYVTSALPIIHLYAPPNVLQPGPTTSTIGGDSQAGSWGLSVYYDGEFYDNIYVSLRGNTTAGYPKKSHRFEFNREHLFRHPGAGYGVPDRQAPRIRRTSFEADYPDPTYMRQGMAFWLCDQIGSPGTFYYPVRLQLNGQFYQLANHNDVQTEEMLERLGYDPNGALYNAAGTVEPSGFSTGGLEKKTRRWDGTGANSPDYQQLTAAIADSNEANVGFRRTNIFDMFDLPNIIDYLVVARFVQENDDVWANMSLYHDNDGDNLWRIIGFDMNLSWGAFYYDNGANDTGIQATNDNHKSFPLYGGSQALSLTSGNYNRVYDAIFEVPQAREMYLRRMRTMLDTFVLPPGTPTNASPIEQKLLAWRDLITAEGTRDRAFWGWPAIGGQNNLPPGTNVFFGVQDLLQQFYYLRRQHFYGKHSVTNSALPIGITKAQNAGIPLSQAPNAYVAIIGVEFSPLSANQDQEFVCLTNPAPFAVDISGWKLDGGVQFTFAPGTVVPANSIFYVSPNVRAFRSRTTPPRGGQALFVLGPYKGQLSARGETLRVLDGFGQPLNTFTYEGAPTFAQQLLRITELMYHPSPHPAHTNAEEFEYIELKNISASTTLNLNGVRFTNGIDFRFSGSAITSLAPGARVLIVKNIAAFTARYGSGLPVAGQYTGNLDNDGERLRLLDGSNEEILDFEYDDDWYPVTDGLGFSLVIVDENAEPDAWGRKTQWRPSGNLNGNPALPDPGPPTIAPILVNEALSRTDTPPPTDSIELFNPTGSDVNIGDWWLTDDFNSPKKFRIPGGTIISASGYRVFTEADFNPGGTGFALSSDGDEVWLFSGDAAGNLTGYVHGHDFGAAEDGVSFGRYVTSDGKERFVAQISRTLGAANSGPRVGPLVINEIMYRPPDLGTSDNSVDEFIEVLNSSLSTVQLFDPARPTNTWKLSGGVDFVLPTNVTLTAGEYMLLVNFNPTNTATLLAFRGKYGVGSGVKIFGPYQGKLDNSSDDVELKKPTTPLAGNVPYVLVDKVSYSDSSPWPPGADGTGLSLQRKDAAAYGNDPANWTAAPVTAAAPATTGGVAPVITMQPQSQTSQAYVNVMFSASATGTAVVHYQWRHNGDLIPGATNSMLQLINVQPTEAGNYDVLAFNAAGSVVSSNATLVLRYPPTIIQQPQTIAPLPGSNVFFTVVAYSPTPVNYQWQKDGVNIPGAINNRLDILNVQPDDSGTYAVIVSDQIGSVMSSPASLIVRIEPVIVQHPLSQSVVAGSTVTLSVGVTNGATLPIGCRWRRNGVFFFTNTFNARTGFLTISNAQPPFTNYQVVVTNFARPSGFQSLAAILTFVPDTDGDGIPDWWEAAYGFATNNVNDADDDTDLDTMLNWQEYIAGTDPRNPLSFLKVDTVSPAPGARLSFMAVSNRTYTVQYSDGLAATTSWQRLVDVAARTSNRVETIPDPGYKTNRYYRLVVPRQP